MPLGLKRYQQARDHHFITFSCHCRRPYLADPASKATVEEVLERTRARHNARIYAYVLMPEHVHLLINETFDISLAMFIKSFKQESSRQLKGTRYHFWQPRYYDFNVRTPEKFSEKIQYIHRNPVIRGLVTAPELYAWSSYNHYATGEQGTVSIESEWAASKRRVAHSYPSHNSGCPVHRVFVSCDEWVFETIGDMIPIPLQTPPGWAHPPPRPNPAYHSA